MSEKTDPRLRLTNSEMKLWRRCRRQWYLAYYLKKGKAEPDFGRPTSLGSRVHNALELLYANQLELESSGGEGWDEVDVIAFLKEGIADDIEKFPGYEAEITKEGDLAVRMLEGYLQWLEETGNDQFLKVVQPEQGVEIPLTSGGPSAPEGVNLLSKIDVRVRDERDASMWALEHKTVQSLQMPLPTLQIDTQLLTEHLVEFLHMLETVDPVEADKQRADGVLYNMLRKVKRTANAKPPFYGRTAVRHNMTELRNHWRHVVAQAREIIDAHERLDAGESHHSVVYPSPTRDCNWDCPFFNVCPLMDDGSDWEGALSDLYVDIDPLDRYNKETKEND